MHPPQAHFLPWPIFFSLFVCLWQFNFFIISRKPSTFGVPWVGTRIVLSLRLGFVVQRDHFCPLGRLEIFLALRSSGRVEIFCPSGLFELTHRPSGQKISTLPLDLSAKKICSRPSGQKWSLWTTKPNLRDKTILVPTLGIPNLLGFLEIMKKLNCQRQTKSAKKNQPRKKKAWVGCKKGAKIFSGYFPLYLGSLNFIRVFPARLYTRWWTQ